MQAIFVLDLLNEKTKKKGRLHESDKEQKVAGDGGYRSPYLSHAKRALYHLSYVPRTVSCGDRLGVSLPELKVILGELTLAFDLDLSPATVHNPR